ncbi:MAG: hypothetical protein LJE66_08260 [Desulfobacterales bacterium]|jgi:short-subunit dehydrogenase|nr:hypothetical protein [Desulfobacterales bacterium]
MNYFNRSKKKFAMIAVTGATGNIGSKIAADILSKAQNVRCVARTAATLSPFAAKGAETTAISLEGFAVYVTKGAKTVSMVVKSGFDLK